MPIVQHSAVATSKPTQAVGGTKSTHSRSRLLLTTRISSSESESFAYAVLLWASKAARHVRRRRGVRWAAPHSSSTELARKFAASRPVQAALDGFASVTTATCSSPSILRHRTSGVARYPHTSLACAPSRGASYGSASVYRCAQLAQAVARARPLPVLHTVLVCAAETSVRVCGVCARVHTCVYVRHPPKQQAVC